ncbi:hypothetical protein ASD54_08710 [Rhizobium sp. Root149]|uniref:hypothetical protein n=1 Tax=Rhizobium sp. Root149 TaxID=1736473 RepID=UPI000713A466|nr:hypothetical protein [Rhizobium sp. Root149]KQZ50326.1 hypothetical protein ASD54_08710 [Rhizobium sp. Root149]
MFKPSLKTIGGTGGTSVDQVQRMVDQATWNSTGRGEHGWVGSDLVVLNGSNAYELYNAGPHANEVMFTVDGAAVADYGDIHVQLIDGSGEVISGYSGYMNDVNVSMNVAVSNAQSIVVYQGFSSGFNLRGYVHIQRSADGFFVSTNFFDYTRHFIGTLAVGDADCTGIRIFSHGNGDGTDNFIGGYAYLQWRN